VADEGEASEGVLHGLLVQRGPELLAFIGLVVIGLGIGLDREWLVGFGLVGLMLGVVLPRIRGSLEAGPTGIKVAEIIDPGELRAQIRAKGKDLPAEAVQRAEMKAGERLAGFTADSAAAADLLDWAAEGLLSENARREWYVTFFAHDLAAVRRKELRSELFRAEGALPSTIIASTGENEPESMTIRLLVNAPSGTEAVNRVRRLVEPFGYFTLWQVEPVRQPGQKDDDDMSGSVGAPAR
jgi:hypothetical protein